RRSHVLPVAAVTGWRGEAPQRDGSTRTCGVVIHVETGGQPWTRVGLARGDTGCPESRRCGGNSRLGIMVGTGAPIETVEPSSPGRSAGGLLQPSARAQRVARFCTAGRRPVP